MTIPTLTNVLAVVGLGFFVLLLICALGYHLYPLVLRARFGKSFLQFNQFPYHPGQTFEASFENPRGIGQFKKITFMLRYIEEVWEKAPVTGTPELQAYQCWADTFTVDQPGEHQPHQSSRSGVPVTFLLPDDRQMTTKLNARPVHYWELHIRADRATVPFEAKFLVPVYAKAMPQT